MKNFQILPVTEDTPKKEIFIPFTKGEKAQIVAVVEVEFNDGGSHTALLLDRFNGAVESVISLNRFFTENILDKNVQHILQYYNGCSNLVEFARFIEAGHFTLTCTGENKVLNPILNCEVSRPAFTIEN